MEAVPHKTREALVRGLRHAYSGERAAARAYAGHWRSVRDADQRRHIQRIMDEELAHRRRVGEMLRELGGAPGRLRDSWMAVVGTMIAASCFIGGWYVPMYGAGRIERRNIREYEDAARLAAAMGSHGFADELLTMAEVEWDHEQYFHDQVRGHWMHGLVGSWPNPPPKQMIRESFMRDTTAPAMRRIVVPV